MFGTDFPFTDFLLSVIAGAYLVEVLLHGDILALMVGKLVRKELYTREDLKNYLMTETPSWLFLLMHCPLCLSFHVGWILAIVLCLGEGLDLSTIILTIPSLAGLISLIHRFMYPSNEAVAKPSVEEPPVPSTGAYKRETTEFLGNVFELQETGEDARKVWKMVSSAEREKWAEEMKSFFDNPDFCNGKEHDCWSLRAEYTEKVAELKIKADKNQKVCTPCELNSLKNKFFQKLKKLYAPPDR